MIRVFVKQGRGLVVLVATLAIAVAACGGSTGTSQPNGTGNNPTGTGSTANPDATGGFASGLYSNLDNLDSYQFSWTYAGAESGATASSMVPTTGTVVNKPTKSYAVTFASGMYITIGAQQWISSDQGATWMVNPYPIPVSTFLPTTFFGLYFAAQADNFHQVGTETKNNIDCIHYQGDSTLGAVFGALSGVSADFHSDLWVAKVGSYPVSGMFGWSVSAGASGGSLSFNFDVTHVNDASNKVAAPSNVIVLPT